MKIAVSFNQKGLNYNMKTVSRMIVKDSNSQKFYLVEIILVEGVGYFWRYSAESSIYQIRFHQIGKCIHRHICDTYGLELVGYEEL